MRAVNETRRSYLWRTTFLVCMVLFFKRPLYTLGKIDVVVTTHDIIISDKILKSIKFPGFSCSASSFLPFVNNNFQHSIKTLLGFSVGSIKNRKEVTLSANNLSEVCSVNLYQSVKVK